MAGQPDSIAERLERTVQPWFENNCQHGTFPSLTPPHPLLRYARFRHLGDRPTATLVFIPGWSESYLKYCEVLYDLRQRLGGGWDFWIMDHCSQGLSGHWSPHDDRGWVADFSDYVKDAEYFVEAVVLGSEDKSAPLHLFAHSMGGLVGAHLIIANPGLFDRVVMSAPMFDVYNPSAAPAPVLRLVAFVVDRVLGRGLDYVPGARKRAKGDYKVDAAGKNLTTSCQERIDLWNGVRRDNPSCVTGGVTWGWLRASFAARLAADTLTYEDVVALERSEVMVLYAERERRVDNAAIAAIAGWVRTCRLVKIAGSLHEAFFEVDTIRNFALDRTVAFLTAPDVTGEAQVEEPRSRPPSRARRRAVHLARSMLAVLVAAIGMRALLLRVALRARV